MRNFYIFLCFMNLDSRHMVLFFMSSPIWKQEMMGHESEKNSLKNYMPTLLLFCKYLITESIARFTSQVSLTRKPCEYLSLVNSSRPNLREAWRPYSLVPRDLDVDRKLHPFVCVQSTLICVESMFPKGIPSSGLPPTGIDHGYLVRNYRFSMRGIWRGLRPL